jgi:hypothetical protein
MAASPYQPDATATSATSSGTQPQQGGQVRLRRAVYIHVSDLTSAYDIDHAKLEQELSRVRGAQQPTEAPEQQAAAAAEGQADLDTETSSYPQKRLSPPRGGYNLCV